MSSDSAERNARPQVRTDLARRARRKILVFLGLTTLAAAIPYAVMIRSGTARDVVLFWMWTPGVAALLAQRILEGSIRHLGWRSPPWRYLVLGYAVPLGYAGPSYGLVWPTRLGDFQTQPSSRIVLFATPGFLAACLSALGEEIGWRGLLLPELNSILSFGRASLVTGVVWAIWHYPAVLFADYRSHGPRWLDLTSLTIAVIGLSYFTGWLRLASGSVWPCVVWHAAHNLFIQQIFYDMTTQTTYTHFFIDDFGLGVLVASLVFGAAAWWAHEKSRPSLQHAAPT